MTPTWYTVVTFSQVPSLYPDPDLEGGLHVCREDAEADRDFRREETARLGRGKRHEVYAVTELEDRRG